MLGAPGAVHTRAREEADRWARDPTCQPHRGEGHAGCAILADGELAGGEITTSSFPAERRNQRCLACGQTSSALSSPARMAVRPCGRTVAGRCRSRWWPMRRTRDPRGGGGRDKGKMEGEERRRSSDHERRPTAAMAAAEEERGQIGPHLSTSRGDGSRLGRPKARRSRGCGESKRGGAARAERRR
jgi:hypothetical protein